MSDQQANHTASAASVFDQVKQMDGLLEKYFEEVLGADLRVEGSGRLACRCPWHEEKTPSCKLDLTGTEARFHCFGACDFGGSIIDAVMRQEGYDQPLDALNSINNQFKLGLTVNSAYYKEFAERVEKATKKLTEGETEWNDKSSKVAAEARKIITERAVNDETREHFRLSVDKDAARILIPILDKGGHPIAWSGRAMRDKLNCGKCGELVEAKEANNLKKVRHHELGHDKKVKWCRDEQCVTAGRTCPHCGEVTLPAFFASQDPKYDDSPGYQKKQNLYNLFGASNVLRKQRNVSEREPLYLVEGFGDVWALHQAGVQGVVAYNGGALTPTQAGMVVKLIKSLSKVAAREDVTSSYRPVVLVPDMDNTGRRNVHTNIENLRREMPEIDVRVVHSIDKLRCTDGTDKPCKDAGDILKYHGEEILREHVQTKTWGADEFKIREILDGPWDAGQQMDLVNDILGSTRHTIHVDGLVPLISERWNRDEGVVRTFLQTAAARGSGLMDSANLIATIKDARVGAEEYLADDFVITTDYDEINKALPGGGFRLGQLSMILGKAQPLDANVLTPSGWCRMGDLQVGDQVVDPAGGTASIVRITPQGVRDIYRLTFTDGSSCECDLLHLWQARVGDEERTFTLQELLEVWPDQPVLIPSYRDGASGPDLQLADVSLTRRAPAQCIGLDSDSRLYVTDDGVVTHNSGTGKTTLIANHLWQFLRRQNLPCVFFSLEQPKGQIYMTLAQIALGKKTKEIEQLIKDRSAELDAVDELFDRLIIVDNVPGRDGHAQSMTPSRVAQLINEINITRAEEPVKVVCIDHLGIIKADKGAPQKVQEDPSGWAMEQFFHVCKQTQTFFMVLQQLPKEVKAGEQIFADSGRGASQQTDFCDYIIGIWRPDQKAGLTEDEKTGVAGQYKYGLPKNRHGPNGIVADLIFDHQTRRIVEENLQGPPTAVQNANAAGVDLAAADSGPQVMFGHEVIDGEQPEPDSFIIDEAVEEIGGPNTDAHGDIAETGSAAPDAQLAGADDDPPDWYLT